MTAASDWAAGGDAELATAAAAGDRDAFAGIYDRYADRLHDFCVGMLRNRDTAADCVQDVFLIAATRLGQLKDPEKLRPWLYSIARNEALRYIRAGGREMLYNEVPEGMSDEFGPEIMASRNELADLVAEAAGALSDRDRAVLELSYRHGLDGSELAEALGVSYANAKKLTQRMRETIERSLGALLVSRRSASNCPALAAVLDGWNGHFTVLMRKRIARHIDSCAECDQERSRLVNPVALLGATPVFIPAPRWLRQHTLGQVQLPTAGQNTDTAFDSDATPPTGARRRRLILAGAIFGAIVVAGLVLTIAGRVEHGPTVTPANHSSTVPPPPAAPPSRAPQVVTAPAATPSPTAESPVTTPGASAPEPSTTSSAVRSAPTTTSMQAPLSTTAPPTSASVPPMVPTFTVPTSPTPPTSAQPPSTVVRPTNPVVRPTATVIKPAPVTTTPPVLQ